MDHKIKDISLCRVFKIIRPINKSNSNKSNPNKIDIDKMIKDLNDLLRKNNI